MWTKEVPSWSPTRPWPVSLQNICENWCWSSYIIPAKTCLFPKISEYSSSSSFVSLCGTLLNYFMKSNFADLCSYWTENKWGKQEINPLLCCFLLKPLTQITQRRESIIGQLLLVWNYWRHHRWYFFPLSLRLFVNQPPSSNTSNPPNWALEAVRAPEQWTQMSARLPA